MWIMGITVQNKNDLECVKTTVSTVGQFYGFYDLFSEVGKRLTSDFFIVVLRMARTRQ